MQLIGRLRPHWAWVLSAVLVVGALAVVHATGPDAGDLGTRAGQFVSTTYPADERADTGTLTFPLGTLTVALTAPISSSRGGLAPPEDGSLLGLATTFRPGSNYSITQAATVPAPVPVLAMVVVADGRRYPVHATDTLSPTGVEPVGARVTGFLGVAGRPRDVRVEATLGGVRQTVRPSTGARDAGRAAGLYRTGRSESVERTCRARRLTAGYRPTRYSDDLPVCRIVGQARSAYVDGLGWAAPGHVWLLVSLQVGRRLAVERAESGRPVQNYSSVNRDDDLDVRIDGRPSAGSPRRNAGTNSPYDEDALAVAQVPTDAPSVTVRIVSTYHRLGNGSIESYRSAPVDPDVSVTWTETLS